MLAAGVLTWLRAPSSLAAALELDERFGLRERVTTLLTLTEEQAQSPAGQALLADVEQHVQSLQVRSRFPLQVAWQKLLFPAVAAVLAVLAVFFEPDLSTLNQNTPAGGAQAALEWVWRWADRSIVPSHD